MKKGSGFYNLEGMISDDSINKYLLTIRGSVNLGVLDVESIDGKESLSKPYSYKITFTSKCKDIPPESLLNIEAMLQIRALIINGVNMFRVLQCGSMSGK
ncbi:hypothetical protein OGX69_21430 [Citrobacter sp. Cb130]|uniref:hypothetical protein n=1 Tax=Citrobacter sp. Cb130 TaxID=2985033 RepID=UPI002578BE8E|nr:hypothetical protein [Citrobacter sp. Cb130]MDM3330376.1 hypothetical protein [Citrobacter sp. Cb130]